MSFARALPYSLSALLLVGLFTPSAALANDDADWEQVKEEDGIVVWQKSIPETSFVAFRGRGAVEADIYTVFSVLYDVDHKTDLMANCVDYRLLKYKSPGNVIVYNRIGSPFFLISDRDSVLETNIIFETEKKRIIAHFEKSEESFFEPPSGVVRTKAVKGHWILEALDNGTTDVTYQVAADPGGMLPSWLVNLASKKLPYTTIQKMRGQVKRDKVYAETRMAVKYLFDFNGLVPSGHPALVQIPEERAKIQAEINALKAKQDAIKP